MIAVTIKYWGAVLVSKVVQGVDNKEGISEENWVTGHTIGCQLATIVVDYNTWGTLKPSNQHFKYLSRSLSSVHQTNTNHLRAISAHKSKHTMGQVTSSSGLLVATVSFFNLISVREWYASNHRKLWKVLSCELWRQCYSSLAFYLRALVA